MAVIECPEQHSMSQPERSELRKGLATALLICGIALTGLTWVVLVREREFGLTDESLSAVAPGPIANGWADRAASVVDIAEDEPTAADPRAEEAVVITPV